MFTLIRPSQSRIKVIHGANDDIFDGIAGATIWNVRSSLVDAFNIPADALAFVNGEEVGVNHRLHDKDVLEFVRRRGRKRATFSDAEILAIFTEQCQPEPWDEDQTPLRRWLFLDADSYKHAPIFDLPPAQVDRLDENFLVSPAGTFAYQNRILPAGRPIQHQSSMKGMVVFDGDVVLPTLLDMKVHCKTGERFSNGTDQGYRARWGAVWMSMTPSEMATQRPGVQKANGTVVIGGLGLGWLLRKVCEKESVERVIMVEKSQELLDWYGYDLCKRYPKVSDVICDDIYNQIGKHGGQTVYLLDIWLLYSDAERDHQLRWWKRRLKKRLWAWGL